MSRRHLPLLLAPLAAVAACTEEPLDQVPSVRSGEYHHFAQSNWRLATNYDEVRDASFDVDGRANDGTDNNIGMLIAAVGTVGDLDLFTASTQAFSSGALVQLHSVRADSLGGDGSVTWRLFQGMPSEPPSFDGTDTFSIASDSGLLTGTIAGGVLRAGPGTVAIRVPFFPGQDPIVFPLLRAQVEVDLTTGRGRIGGGVDVAVFDDEILPTFAAQAAAHIAVNPDDPRFATAIRYLDDDDDGVVEPEEIMRTTRQLLTLDLDLGPQNHDGSPQDAYSFGTAFELVTADFDAGE